MDSSGIHVCGQAQNIEELNAVLALHVEGLPGLCVPPEYFLERFLGAGTFAGGVHSFIPSWHVSRDFCTPDRPSCRPCPLHHNCLHYRQNRPPSCGLTFSDFFCGIGGLSHGFEDDGFEPVHCVDIDEWSINTLKYNSPYYASRAECMDMREWLSLHGQGRPTDAVDVVMGGVPCQSFSTANRQRQSDDPRDELYRTFLNAAKLCAARVVVLENVSGITRVQDEICTLARELGYEVATVVVNAVDYGVPQNRKRIFYLCASRAAFDDAASRVVALADDIASQQKPGRCLADAIGDLPKLKASTKRNKTEYESKGTGYAIALPGSKRISSYVEEINYGRKPTVIYNHKSRYNNDRDIEIFQKLAQGDNSLSDAVKDIMPYSSRNHMFKDKYYRLRLTDSCKTITSHMRWDCNMYIHPTQARGLTVREAARVQGFPDNFVLTGTFQRLYQQVGNAVPPPVSRVIAGSVKRIMFGL